MNVGEIAARVKRQFGDEAGAQINDADIIRWVNDAQRELTATNGLMQTTATAAIKKGQDQYHLPPDILTLHSVRVRGRRLERLTPEQAANWVPNIVPDATGTPTHFSQWSTKVDLFPTPDYDDPNDFQVYYTRNPIPIHTLDDTPELPLQYHNRIVEYCIAQAHELDDNMQSYQVKMQMFTEGAKGLVDLDKNGQDVYPSISVSDADTGYGEWYAG